ncbi:MAG: Acetylornithine deacetylase [uncultured Truepera sp.]|uniref:Acetylornithine deacetylase n=1 Tax=uncultured Truepera sp. TaxID=543023 RepID=A0A6J4VPU1_9DEIN|nr:MAG: Acetylornithine deacetylase [uncultured Truepera sp.]
MSQLQELTDLLRRVCETPAPTFAEGTRGALVAGMLRDMGLSPHTDAVGNVTAEVPGGCGPRILLAAHLDTVFAAETDVRVREREGRLAAPGIGDNSASLAVALFYLRDLQHGAGACHPRLSFAATVGEEGLGDLRGMRALMTGRAHDFDGVIALDGHLGGLIHASVGSKRFEVTFRARGGHSWGDFPSPSATHALGEGITALAKLPLSEQPRSSYNVGQVWGGTGVNAIAEAAGFNLDLRSTDADVLGRLSRDALGRLHKVAARHGVQLETRGVGDRPTAFVPNEGLVRAGQQALQEVAVRPRLAASSTDANAAMAAGLPAIAFGVYRGGDAHRLSEWLEPASLTVGLEALTRLLAAVSALAPRDLRRAV